MIKWVNLLLCSLFLMLPIHWSRSDVISRMADGGAAVFSYRAPHTIISSKTGARSMPFGVREYINLRLSLAI